MRAGGSPISAGENPRGANSGAGERTNIGAGWRYFTLPRKPISLHARDTLSARTRRSSTPAMDASIPCEKKTCAL